MAHESQRGMDRGTAWMHAWGAYWRIDGRDLLCAAGWILFLFSEEYSMQKMLKSVQKRKNVRARLRMSFFFCTFAPDFEIKWKRFEPYGF